MHKFRFKLEGVLSVKMRLEEQAKAAFASAMQTLNACEQKRDEAAARVRAYEQKLEELVNGILNITEITVCKDAIRIVREDLVEKENAVKRAQNRVEMCRKNLSNAIMERKTIEKLKEKEFEEYIKEYNDEERKQIDELVSYRHNAGV
ncbi:MAG: flagellar export protein FliJ [Lachnospiraceae bacterium]|nr:flagellar export protein FliJ [Lachnospiraceae bacterium]MBO4762337.1 flagellar export protein FliJ [Lachnospiraceae bacterium]MBQ6091848.1 flagellar export protein FliJ [Lachnospiraceae bacterium]MBR5369469.1 flagellar export protein FliJ [Lachnospiraceae bacterium]